MSQCSLDLNANIYYYSVIRSLLIAQLFLCEFPSSLEKGDVPAMSGN